MLKYRGRYRVVFESDKLTGKLLEITFIPCRICKGANICRHTDTLLNVYIPSKIIFNRLLNEYPELFTAFQTGQSEGTLLLNEYNIDKATHILKAWTRGKCISPRTKTRNLCFAS
ncbi:MAG TPA: hypothetical protein VF941_06645 [Clostridia bacterium]